mmetsp:Transcript_46784/g.120578  ORF Transcript_46784/g.120578 Transcript_46784/m.120578 type:complete len:187 (-) Transcript_46784:219-779(-)
MEEVEGSGQEEGGGKAGTKDEAEWCVIDERGDGTAFQGYIDEEGKRQHFGKEVGPDSSYLGGMEDDQPHGRGVARSGATVCVGRWKKGVRHGHCTTTEEVGDSERTIFGTYFDGELRGHAEVLNEDGSIVSAEYGKDGQPVGTIVTISAEGDITIEHAGVSGNVQVWKSRGEEEEGGREEVDKGEE